MGGITKRICQYIGSQHTCGSFNFCPLRYAEADLLGHPLGA